jgi:hypothetical protein
MSPAAADRKYRSIEKTTESLQLQDFTGPPDTAPDRPISRFARL